MLTSKYIGPLREEAASWAEKLKEVEEVLEIWLEVQDLWQYLEEVFSSPTTAKVRASAPATLHTLLWSDTIESSGRNLFNEIKQKFDRILARNANTVYFDLKCAEMKYEQKFLSLLCLNLKITLQIFNIRFIYTNLIFRHFIKPL